MSDLLRWGLHVEDVLLEESVLAVHMCAVEQTVAIDDLVPEVSLIV